MIQLWSLSQIALATTPSLRTCSAAAQYMAGQQVIAKTGYRLPGQRLAVWIHGTPHSPPDKLAKKDNKQFSKITSDICFTDPCTW